MPTAASMATDRPLRPSQLPSRWRKLLRRIPGYDPIATAGDCVFDIAAAKRALDFFPMFLVHVKGELAGQPLTLLPWQKAVIANLFGWKRPDGTRRYRKAFIEVACKNGKSTLLAGIALYLLFYDDEPGAEIYSAAADREQAAIVYEIAKAMVLATPRKGMRSRAKVYKSWRRILDERSGSYYTPLSSDAPTKHGLNAQGILFDELHAQPNRDLYDALMSRMGARRQPLAVFITTAGFDTASICAEEYGYACKIRDGLIDNFEYLPAIYEAAKEDDWHKPSTWRKANPSLGKSVKADFLRSEHKKACDTPSYENTFRRLYLDQWTEQAERWLSLDDWDRCSAEIPLDELMGAPCWLGLDLSTTRDLTALAALFDVPAPALERLGLEPPAYSLHVWLFVPAESAHKREIRDRVPYATWGRQGLITLTEGNVIDYEIVREMIEVVAERHRVQHIAIDRWNAAQMSQQLQAKGIDVVPFGQGFASMLAPTKEFERLVVSGKLLHGGHPVLRWAASNVAIDHGEADAIKPSKKRSIERIDPIVASIMALGIRMTLGPVSTRSVYEDRGPLVLG